MAENKLCYGDNLDILRRYVEDESVGLVYLDPPFKSNQDYNVLFEERNGSRSAAQIKAFEDTWAWDLGAEEAYTEVVEAGAPVSEFMQGMRGILHESDMMAYLAMMAPRLVELRRVLKPTGSIYLHCDPTAGAHLRLLMDAVFGPRNFRNEIIWQRSHPHGNVTRAYGCIHDIILFYSKDDQYQWNQPHQPYFLADGTLDPEFAAVVLKQYNRVEEETGRRFQATSLLNPNPDRPNLTYDFHGHTRVWRWTRERMEKAEREGKLCFPRGGKGIPREKRYLDEQEGYPLQDIWNDVPPISPQAAERLGYPTQKPEALLERIVRASSKEGDLVLDPFCGCGTAVVVAQRFKRRWIGIDITHLAITLIRHRLRDAFPDKVIEDERVVRGVEYDVIGEPPDVKGAAALAQQDPYQFQFWALGLVGARPVEEKRGADRGIDGRLYFHDEKDTRKTKQIILQVKSGHAGVKDVRELIAVVEREKAQMGALISLQEPTRPMRTEAAAAGFYESPWWERKFPRIQLLTVGGILRGKLLEYPPRTSATFRKGPKAKGNPGHRQTSLDECQG